MMKIKMKMKTFSRLCKDASGSQIAEAAAVLPLLIMVVMGIMWFGRAFNIYATVNRAAREGAQAAGSSVCATCGVNDTPAALASAAVDPILSAAHLDTTLKTLSTPTLVVLNSTTTPQEVGYVITLSYPYSLHLNGLTCCPVALTPLTTGITITATAQARQEN